MIFHDSNSMRVCKLFLMVQIILIPQHNFTPGFLHFFLTSWLIFILSCCCMFCSLVFVGLWCKCINLESTLGQLLLFKICYINKMTWQYEVRGCHKAAMKARRWWKIEKQILVNPFVNSGSKVMVVCSCIWGGKGFLNPAIWWISHSLPNSSQTKYRYV